MGLQPLACWDCGFECRRGHGCLSFVSVVYCQVEVSTTGLSLVQRSHKECVCVSVCLIVIKEPHRGGVDPLELSSHEKKKNESDMTVNDKIIRKPSWSITYYSFRLSLQLLCNFTKLSLLI
jgi:hypothetical protein